MHPLQKRFYLSPSNSKIYIFYFWFRPTFFWYFFIFLLSNHKASKVQSDDLNIWNHYQNVNIKMFISCYPLLFFPLLCVQFRRDFVNETDEWISLIYSKIVLLFHSIRFLFMRNEMYTYYDYYYYRYYFIVICQQWLLSLGFLFHSRSSIKTLFLHVLFYQPRNQIKMLTHIHNTRRQKIAIYLSPHHPPPPQRGQR